MDEMDHEGFFLLFLVDNGVMFLPVKNFGISAIELKKECENAVAERVGRALR